MIHTSRLTLVPLSHELLLLYKNDPKSLAARLGVHHLERQHEPEIVPHIEEALEFWLRQTKAHPDKYPWYTTWEIILKEEQIAIGGIGFSGEPDAGGKILVGYGLDMRYYGKGYASEALDALKGWAFDHPEVKQITADTPVDHIASHRVLLKCGFKPGGTRDGVIRWNVKR
jgi:ribosomal-protein-alanine N-acetyltransferase